MYRNILLLTLLLMLAGCAAKNESPGGVAYDFWMAEKAQKIDRAARLTLDQDAESARLHRKIKIEDMKLGDPEIKGTDATVPTTLTLGDFSPLGHEKTTVTFETHLKKHEKAWRVDTFATKKSFYLATTKAYAEALGKDFASTIRNALGEREQIKGVFEELMQGLKKALGEKSKTN